MRAFLNFGFISFIYPVFLFVAALVYYVVPKKAAPYWLFLVSMVFYAQMGPKFLPFLGVSILSVYLGALVLGKKNGRAGSAVFVLVLLVNLGLLFVMKYLGLFVPAAKESIAAPVGISFYTLQALSYLIDVRRGKLCPEKNLIRLALYVSFFPCVTSGPIERAGNMLSQFRDPQPFSYENMRHGLCEMLWGYFLKLVLADRMAVMINTIYGNPQAYHGILVVLAVCLYSFQIYCDFAGYSYIAMGSARVLGIRVMNNFNAPYLSGSVAEFWRRWHISLSLWLRDYVYIPLGGNRKGTVRKYLNVILTFAVSGIWHGVGITFLVWGLLHAGYQVLGRLLKPVRDGAVRLFSIQRTSFGHRMIKVIFTFMLVSVAWVFFRSPDLAAAWTVLKCMRGWNPSVLFDGTLYTLGLDRLNVQLLAAGLLILVITDLIRRKGISIYRLVTRQELWIRWILYIGITVLILVCGIWGPGYSSASFIYSQF